MTQRDDRARTRGCAKRKTAFGRVPLLLTCGNTTGGIIGATTLRDWVTVGDPRTVVIERDIGLIVTFGGMR